MPDYVGKTCKQLRALLATRRIQHKDLKLKAQLIAAALKSDAVKRKAEQELEKENSKRLEIEYDVLLAQMQERGLEVEGTTPQALQATLQHDDERKRAEAGYAQ